MSRNAQGMNSQEAIKLAKIYYQEGRRIAYVTKEDIDANSDSVYKCIVGNTNLAFACEVALKALLLKQGMPFDELPKTHRLEDLFMSLSDTIKNQVVSKTVALCRTSPAKRTYTTSDFYNDLADNTDAFETSRYWYELPASGGLRHAAILFISSFAQALVQLADTLNNAQQK